MSKSKTVKPTGVAPGRGPPPEERFTPEKKRQFLELYRHAATTVAKCAEVVGISTVSVFTHVRSDPAFAKAYELAKELNTDHVEEMLYEHALDKSQPGNLIAIFGVLKARRPEKYREVHKVEHAGQLVMVTADALAQARQRTQQEQPRALN